MTTPVSTLIPALTKSLEDVARLLDIPDDVVDEATARYEAVAAWLGDETSPLRQHAPELYPQGSFRLGTTVRPLLANDEFDIDLVCGLDIRKESTTQKDLKALVGDRLKASAELEALVHERRRCWQLKYTKRFHLDVLPAIPDGERPGQRVDRGDTRMARAHAAAAWHPAPEAPSRSSLRGRSG
jgi:hypothetical protein